MGVQTVLTEEVRQSVMKQAQGAQALGLAFVGIANGLFGRFQAPLSVAEAAALTKKDEGYLRRWCEAAYAFGFLQFSEGKFSVTELGRAFRPEAEGSLMPMAVQAMLGMHMMERASSLLVTGERPGEKVLAERASILPWFGPMLEMGFGRLFESEILPKLKHFEALNERGGLVVDLGCGNGWYLRALLRKYPSLRGVGLDGFDENIQQAKSAARNEGLEARLTFQTADIFSFKATEPVDALVMNRALHHVWFDKEKVFQAMRGTLTKGGFAVVWEPAWPDTLDVLTTPRYRMMAFQNLSEHIQGNHFLRPNEIEAEFEKVGMSAHTLFFGEGSEAVIVGVNS